MSINAMALYGLAIIGGFAIGKAAAELGSMWLAVAYFVLVTRIIFREWLER